LGVLATSSTFLLRYQILPKRAGPLHFSFALAFEIHFFESFCIFSDSLIHGTQIARAPNEAKMPELVVRPELSVGLAVLIAIIIAALIYLHKHKKFTWHVIDEQPTLFLDSHLLRASFGRAFFIVFW
jgi:uncharacterized membrane protein